MKIAHVVHGFPPDHEGGTERYVLKLALAQRALGHEVLVLTGASDSREHPGLDEREVQGLRVLRVGRSGLFLDDWQRADGPETFELLRTWLEEEQPDLVHVHHWLRLGRRLVQAASAAGVPAVVTLHDAWTGCPRLFRVRDGSHCALPVGPDSCADCVPRRPWMDDEEVRGEVALHVAEHREELALARAIIVPTAAHAAHLRAGDPGGVAQLDLTVVPHGRIASGELAPAKPRHDKNLFRFAHWGQLSVVKGVPLILDAIGRLSEELRSQIHLDILGTAEDAAGQTDLEAAAQGLPVFFHGAFRPRDLGDRPIDWAIFASVASESWSFVLDEAWSLGVPVIAPERGAFAERVGAAGIGFEPESAADLARVIEMVVRDDQLRERAREAIVAPAPMADHAQDLVAKYERWITAKALGASTRALGRQRVAQEARRRAARLSRMLHLEGGWEGERKRAAALERDLEAATEAARRAEEQRAGFASSVKEFKDEREQRTEALKALEVDRKRWQDQANEIAGDRERLRREATDVTKDRERWKREAAQLSEDRDRVLGELRAMTGDRDRWLEEHRVQGDALNAQVAALDKTIAELRMRGEAAEREALSAQRSADELRRERDEFQARNASLERDLEQAERKLATIAGDLELARERVRQSQLRIEEQNGQLAKLADLRRSVHGQDVALRWQAAREGAFVRRVAELLDVQHDLAGWEEALAALELAWKQAAAGRDEEERQRLDAAALARQLEQELARERARADALEAEMQARWENPLFRLSERLAGRGRPRVGDLDLRPKGATGPRILFVIHQFLPRHAAGSEIYTLRLAQALQRHAQVAVLTTEAHRGVYSYAVRNTQVQGVPVIEVSHQHTTEFFEATWRNPAMERIFEDVLDRYQPDVIHFQHTAFHSIGYLDIAAQRGIPTVYTLHEYFLLCPRNGQMRRANGELCEIPVPTTCAECLGELGLRLGPPDPDEGRRPAKSRASRLLGRSSEAPAGAGASPHERTSAIRTRLDDLRGMLGLVDQFISPSAFLKERFVVSGMIPEDRILVSDNGQDPRPFASIARKESEGLRVGYIGTIAEYKGVHVLVEALNRLVGVPGVEGHIYGGLESFAGYAEELRASKLNPLVTLHGRYDPSDVGAVLSNLDVLVVPSLWFENSPLTIKEAFLAGVPVVCSKLGGMRDNVRDGVDGLYFRTGDAGDLAQVLRRLATEPDLLTQLKAGVPAVKTIDEDAEVMIERYRGLLARRSGSPAS